MTTDPKALVAELRQSAKISEVMSGEQTAISRMENSAAACIEQLQKELADECASRTRAGEQRQRAEKAERERDEALEDSERNFQMFKTRDLHAKELAVRAEKAESALAAATAERKPLRVHTPCPAHSGWGFGFTTTAFANPALAVCLICEQERAALTKAKGAT